jgi:hypothetical protein
MVDKVGEIFLHKHDNVYLGKLRGERKDELKFSLHIVLGHIAD